MASKNKPPIVPPTREQMRRAQFDEQDIVDRNRGKNMVIGKAFRRRRMVEVLALQGLLSDAETKALQHYRHHADIADRSPVRDSLNTYRSGGDGSDPTITMITAIRIRDDCERAAGALVDILRAVVVNDQSLSEWAMEHGGSTEECEVRNGRRKCRLKPKRKALAIARLDMQMAAKRVASELDA